MQHWLEGHLCVWKTVSTRGHYIRALHGEGGIKGEGVGPNHPVEREPTLTMGTQDIEKELKVLYELGEPIIPFWDQSLHDPAPAKAEEPPGTPRLLICKNCQSACLLIMIL